MSTSLLEALGAWLQQDAEVQAMFKGGVWNTTAPLGTVLPYLTLVKAESRSQRVIGAGKWVEWITIHFEVRHTSGEATEALFTWLRNHLFQSEVTLRLRWDDGHECSRYLVEGQATELEEGLGPGGTDVWVARLPVIFITAHELTPAITA